MQVSKVCAGARDCAELLDRNIAHLHLLRRKVKRRCRADSLTVRMNQAYLLDGKAGCR